MSLTFMRDVITQANRHALNLFTAQYPAYLRILKQSSYVVSSPAMRVTSAPYDLRNLHFHSKFLATYNLSIQIK